MTSWSLTEIQGLLDDTQAPGTAALHAAGVDSQEMQASEHRADTALLDLEVEARDLG